MRQWHETIPASAPASLLRAKGTDALKHLSRRLWSGCRRQIPDSCPQLCHRMAPNTAQRGSEKTRCALTNARTCNTQLRLKSMHAPSSIHVYVPVHPSAYQYVCLYVYAYAHAYKYNIYICIYIYIHKHIFKYMYVYIYMYIYIYVCVYVCISLFIYICTYTHTSSSFRSKGLVRPAGPLGPPRLVGLSGETVHIHLTLSLSLSPKLLYTYLPTYLPTYVPHK